MSADNVILGPEAKIDIENVAYGTVSGRYRVIADVVKRTDTESTSVRAKRSSLRQIEVNLVAHRATDVSYHIPPFSFGSGDSVWVRIWPNGRNDPDGPIDIPALVLRSVEGDWNVQGSPVQGITLDGESDDDFFLPGE